MIFPKNMASKFDKFRFLDLWECHKQFKGISKPRVEVFIEDIIPDGI